MTLDRVDDSICGEAFGRRSSAGTTVDPLAKLVSTELEAAAPR